MEKKIVLVICEGDSDKKALQILINQYLADKHISTQIGCEVYGTDFLFHDLKNPNEFSAADKILERIKEAILDFLAQSKNKSRYKWSDILAVTTISDLDACYCDPKDVVSGNGIIETTTEYDCSRRKIFCNDVVFIRERNEWKKEALGILYTTDFILPNNYKIAVPFRAFYNNLNLEHSLYNDTNCNSEDQKNHLARTFVQNYRNKPIDFYKYISSIPSLSPKGDYKQSWNEYQLLKHAFDRLTNIKIMIDWIVDLAKKV